MNSHNSNYEIPIFISSTEYNLIDLRAELETYLSDLGYKPVLSSADGFHDYSPEYQPWESCLKVLQTCYVMVLIIDGRYGEPLDWPNFNDIIGERKVSPTHGEYLFASQTKKRMLVFMREEVYSQYQNYRSALKSCGNDSEQARELFKKTSPKHISYETMEFLGEVKTKSPIPWIKSFKSVTDIKKEVQKKLLNQLAEVFLLNQQHLETVIKLFSSAVGSLPEDQRKVVLERIGVTKELFSRIDVQAMMISELGKEKDILVEDLESVKKQLAIANEKKDETVSELKSKVKSLEEKLSNVHTKIASHETINADYILQGQNVKYYGGGLMSNLMPTTLHPHYTTGIKGDQITDRAIYSSSILQGELYKPKCDKCKKSAEMWQPLNSCPTCKRSLCPRCYTGVDGISYSVPSEKCIDCRINPTITLGHNISGM